MTYDKDTIRDIQIKTGATADGIFGPSTVAHIANWHAENNPNNDLSSSEFSAIWEASPIEEEPIPSCVDNWDVRRHLAADPSRAYLIDVSHYQGDIDYSRFIANGTMGVIMRTTIGVHSEDKRWRDHWKAFKTRKHPVGAYHLMILVFEGKRTNPRECAESFVRKIKEAGAPELGYWGDAEHSEVEKLVELHGQESAAKWIFEWCLAVEEMTAEPARLYTSMRVISKLLGDYGQMLKPYAQWWASYVKEDDDPLPLGTAPYYLPEGFDWLIWQYTSHGINVGVSSSRCDLNAFNGSPDEFRRFFKLK